MSTIHIVQLPFPSTRAPQPDLSNYYKLYEREFARDLPEYFIPDGGLWEMPLWVAHITALLDELSAESLFSDLGRSATARDCLSAMLEVSAPGDTVLMSPLAQNFDLAVEISRALMASGRRTVLGGNMAPWRERKTQPGYSLVSWVSPSFASCCGRVPAVSC